MSVASTENPAIKIEAELESVPVFSTSVPEDTPPVKVSGRIYKSIDRSRILAEILRDGSREAIILEIEKKDILSLAADFEDMAGRKTYSIQLSPHALLRVLSPATSLNMNPAHDISSGTAEARNGTANPAPSWLQPPAQLDRIAGNDQYARVDPFPQAVQTANGAYPQTTGGYYRLEGNYWYFVPADDPNCGCP